MDTESGFRAHLRSEPDDDATRRVYADWLSEKDDSVSPASVTFNVEYYILGHLGKFVLPGAHRIDSKLAPAITLHQLDEARQALRPVPPDRVKLRRRIQTGLIRLQDPHQPVALQVTLGGDRFMVGDDPRLSRRITDRHPPRERQRRRLDRGRLSRRRLCGECEGRRHRHPQ